MAPLKTNVKCKHFTRGKHCRRNVSSHFLVPSTFRFYSKIAKAFRLAAFYVCFVKHIFWWAGPKCRIRCCSGSLLLFLQFYFFLLLFLFLLALLLIYVWLILPLFPFALHGNFKAELFAANQLGTTQKAHKPLFQLHVGSPTHPRSTTFKKQQPR